MYLKRAVGFLLATMTETDWVMRDRIFAVDLKMSSMLRVRSRNHPLIRAMSLSVSVPGFRESTYRR